MSSMFAFAFRFTLKRCFSRCWLNPDQDTDDYLAYAVLTGLKSAKKPALIKLAQVLGVPEIVPTYHKNGTVRAVTSEEYVTRIIQRLIDIKGELQVC